MPETRHDSTKSTHCRDVGALSLEPPRRQGMQRNYETYNGIPIVLGHFVNPTVLHITWGIEMINLFLPNHRCKPHSFACVDLRAAMFSIPSCAWVDSSGRLFHDLSRKHAGKHVSRIMSETSWDVEQTKNRLPFPAKTTFQI